MTLAGSTPQGAWSSDQELIDEVNRGDEAAMRAVLLRFGKLVGKIAWQYSNRRPEDARDLQMTIWLHLLVKLRDWRWREDGSLGGFVARTARNRALDWVRKMQRTPEGRSIDELIAIGQEPPDPAADPVRLAAIQAVRDCLDQMSNTRHRLAIELQLLGLEHAEIGEIFHARNPAVASWISRGREELKPCLEKTIAMLRVGRR
jgi:RNA polymerase sigma factor (sigma-70 family)